MKKSISFICLSFFLAGTSLVQTSCSDDFEGPETKPWEGEGNMNTSVDPGYDFYRYANGSWMARTSLPSGWQEWGPWQLVETDAEAKVRMMYQSSNNALIQNYTLMAQDKLNRAERSADALRPLLKEIQNVSHRDRLLTAIASMQKAGYSPFFEVHVVPHEFNSRVYLPLLKVSSTYFDADRYRDPDFYAAYRQLLANTVALLFPEIPLEQSLKMADDALRVQQQLRLAYATSQKSGHQSRATDSSILNLLNQCGIRTTCVYDPETNIDVANDLILSGDLEQLKSYMACLLVEQNAYMVSFDIQRMWLDFEKRFQTGSIHYRNHHDFDVNTANAEDAWACLNRFAPEFVGRLYAEKYITEPRRKKMDLIVADLRQAFKERLRDSIRWMGEETRNTALDKLNAVTVMSLRPESWPKCTEIRMDAQNYCAATAELRRQSYEHRLELFDKQIAERNWEYVLHTAPLFRPACFYEPRMNALIITAAFAGEEFMDELAASSRLYGGAGFRIARELVHGFDEEGSRYNQTGALADWWKVSDRSAYTSLKQDLVNRYGEMEVLPGVFCDGPRVSYEAAADLGGLQIACQAFESELRRRGGNAAQKKQDRQHFFLSFAQTLAKVTTDDYKMHYYTTSSFPYDELRVQGTVPVLYRWYEAFDIQSDARMYLSPAQRVGLW